MGESVKVDPAAGSVTGLFQWLAQRHDGHLQLMDGRQPIELNPLVGTVVYQIDSPKVVRALQQALLRTYPPTQVVSRFRGAATESVGECSLDRLEVDFEPDPSGWIYLPPLAPEQAVSSPFGLRAVVHRLRAPGGCPWDREQTPASLVRFVLEEAAEVADAIESGQPAAVCEELGDLLLQVYLQAEIAAERAQFDLNDVIRGLTDKLIRRHPHVFADLEVAGAGEVERNWEQLKRAEKPEAGSPLDRIPRHLPALARAQEIQRTFKKVGFDWHDAQSVRNKLDEELAELRQAEGDPAAYAAELGDVLFMLAKLATDAGLDAESALRGASRRIDSRFRSVERRVAEQGGTMRERSTEQLLELWRMAKLDELPGQEEGPLI